MILYIFFFELRKRMGGYNLYSFYKCYFANVAIYLAVMLTVTSLVKYQQWMLGTVVIAALLCISKILKQEAREDEE